MQVAYWGLKGKTGGGGEKGKIQKKIEFSIHEFTPVWNYCTIKHSHEKTQTMFKILKLCNTLI